MSLRTVFISILLASAWSASSITWAGDLPKGFIPQCLSGDGNVAVGLWRPNDLANEEERLLRINLSTGEHTTLPDYHRCTGIDFDGSHIVLVSSPDRSAIRLWEPATGDLTTLKEGYQFYTGLRSITADGSLVFYREVSVVDGKQIHTYRLYDVANSTEEVTSIGILSTSGLYLFDFAPTTITIEELSTGTQRVMTRAESGCSSDFSVRAVSDDGNNLLLQCANDEIRRYDLSTSSKELLVPAPGETSYSIANGGKYWSRSITFITADLKHVSFFDIDWTSSQTMPNGYYWFYDGDAEHLFKLDHGSLISDDGRKTTIGVRVPFSAGQRRPMSIMGNAFNVHRGTMKASDYDFGGEGIAYHDITTGNVLTPPWRYRRADDVDRPASPLYLPYTNIGHIQAGEWLEYSISSPETELYDLSFKVASPLDGGIFHVEIDGVDVTGPVEVPNTGGWGKDSYEYVTAKDVYIGEGSHILRWVAEKNARQHPFVGNLESISFHRKDDGQAPFFGSPFRVGDRIQAEHFDLTDPGITQNGLAPASYSDNTPTNDASTASFRLDEGPEIATSTHADGGFNVGTFQAGEWMEYTVKTPYSGAYDLNFRVASQLDNGVFHLEYNGEDISGPIVVPNPGGWQNWQDVSVKGVWLQTDYYKQDSAVLRLVADRNADQWPVVANVDYFSIEEATSTEQKPYRQRSISCGEIDAEHFDLGGPGVAYFDTTPGNNAEESHLRLADDVDVAHHSKVYGWGEHNVGNIEAGEWLEYTFDASTAGLYDLDFRLASPLSNGQFRVEVDGNPVGGPVAVPNTDGWLIWTYTSLPEPVHLDEGTHVLRWIAHKNADEFPRVANLDRLRICRRR